MTSFIMQIIAFIKSNVKYNNLFGSGEFGYSGYVKIVSMWQETKEGLYRAFEFKDFKEAFAFMEQVAHLAEEMHHHPRWTNEYNKLEIWLSTHEANGAITDKDRELAKQIDEIKE